jgi:hypothetical protein
LLEESHLTPSNSKKRRAGDKEYTAEEIEDLKTTETKRMKKNMELTKRNEQYSDDEIEIGGGAEVSKEEEEEENERFSERISMRSVIPEKFNPEVYSTDKIASYVSCGHEIILDGPFKVQKSFFRCPSCSQISKEIDIISNHIVLGKILSERSSSLH